MSYAEKYYTEAENLIENRRVLNINKLEKREQEIFNRFPEYSELNRQLMQTGKLLTNIILSKNNSANAKIKEIARRNIEIQSKMEAILVKNGYPKNYLDNIYTCEKCKDTGIYNYKRCSCFGDMLKQLATDEINKSTPIKLCSFETFDLARYSTIVDGKIGMSVRDLMKDNLNFCKSYADNFHLPVKGIFMYGQTGLGKTHLSLSIAKQVLSLGYSVIYGSVPDLLRKIETEHFSRNSANDTEELLQKTDLLILDDLGAEYDNQFYVSALYNLINSRMNLQLPTIISTNYSMNDLKARYSDRIASRIFSMKRMLFYGNDLRLQK